MSNIYDQHCAAFASVSAYVVLHNGERVATIAFKYPRDGAGRLYAYVHWIGQEMVRGYAGGGGYDKHSAACSIAIAKLKSAEEERDDREHTRLINEAEYDAFRAALSKDDGYYWHDNLRKAGFTVLQAV